jgi:osmotically inducible protein OsmC
LIVSAKVPGIDEAKFQECVKNAEENCPISKLLGKGLEISSTGTLVA